MKRIKSICAVLTALVALGVSTDSGDLVIGGRDANAVVGRPLTPVSYAGVARRTTRRTVRRTAYATAPAQQTTVVINTLPAGCQQNGDVYVCGNTQYQAAYDGDTVVYQQL
jgi:hypothetical protein